MCLKWEMKNTHTDSKRGRKYEENRNQTLRPSLAKILKQESLKACWHDHVTILCFFFFFFFFEKQLGFKKIYDYLFIFGGTESLLLFRVFSSCSAQISHFGGFSCCVARALERTGSERQVLGSGAQAQYLWRTGLVAPRHLGSSQTRDWTCVSCIGRWILDQWATREALGFCF